MPQQFSNPTRVQRSLLMGTGEYMVAWPVFLGITLTYSYYSSIINTTISEFSKFSMILIFMITIMSSITVVIITIRDSRASGVEFSLDILHCPACYG